MIHNYKIPTYRIYYKENDKEYATSIYVDNEEEIELLLYRLNFLAKNKKYFIKSVKNEKDV